MTTDVGKKKCAGTTRAGKPCSVAAQHGKKFCYFHDPEKVEERHSAQARGGKGGEPFDKRVKMLVAALDEGIEARPFLKPFRPFLVEVCAVIAKGSPAAALRGVGTILAQFTMTNATAGGDSVIDTDEKAWSYLSKIMDENPEITILVLREKHRAGTLELTMNNFPEMYTELCKDLGIDLERRMIKATAPASPRTGP